MLVRDRRTSSANGAFGLQERQDSRRNEAGHGRIGVAVERAKVNHIDGPARWTACWLEIFA
jgi:hypothetical protein